MSNVLTKNKTSTNEGYKKTKLGWIPEEWKVFNLEELGEFSKGKGIAKKDILENDSEGYPSIRYAEIYTSYNYYTHSLKTKVNGESVKNSNPITYGDILFAGSGETLEDIGKSIAYLGNEVAYAGGDIIILKQNSQHSQYLGYLLNNDIVRNQLFKLGQGHSVVHIYSSGLKKVKILLPPLPEQQKIAKVLSTWDKAIALQEQLITQKQALKKGLMQDLLTGKKRFPGFEEEWEEVKLGDIFTIKNGKDYKHLGNGEIPVYGTGGIMTYVDSFLYNGESVGIGRKGTIDKPFYLKGKFWTVDTLFYCVSFKSCIPKYLYYLFNTINWKTYNEASGVPSLSQSTIKSIKIRIPKISEQQKIASVLSNFDIEIEKLITHKKSLIQQKQGLMQQLLSGEKRVKILKR
ncbi:restriction endonuclease subunit S [Psychroflexus lacisalsi]|uniref:Type I restriction modification DNA specificity domain-containing protein n=1 Tax=Psychroflexus lacisalsi TaxID=503928 RepID=A0ABN1K0Z7_9FLAO|nr:restriction endonuclease subunit S [Psychroflexus lacisalsi]MBZ9620739.1 restriction endonuclease subunit S [Psychroflexus lacisalsi]